MVLDHDLLQELDAGPGDYIRFCWLDVVVHSVALFG